jgi:hypothetical protein
VDGVQTNNPDRGVNGVWTDPSHPPPNYFSSYTGNTITLNAPPPTSSKVYITYGARDPAPGAIEADPIRAANFPSDVASELDAIRSAIGPSKAIIINTNLNSSLTSLASVTGKMNEE